jgi:CRP/FNR family transcriptional regulator, cyclic AMP receptor protein
MGDGGTQSLSGIELLDSMAENDLKKLEQRCTWRLVSKQEVIVDRRSESSDIYFVVSGKVRVSIFHSPGARLLSMK